MTDVDITKPNHALDKLVHEAVMWCEDYAGWEGLREYSARYLDSWLVKQRLEEEGWDVRISHDREPETLTIGVVAAKGDRLVEVRHHRDLPLALCILALKVREVL